MDVATMITELDDHGFADTASTRKVAMLQDTIDDICAREIWPFLMKEATLTFNGGSITPNTGAPTDMAAILDIVNTVDGSSPQPERWEVLKSRYGQTLATDPGMPLYFYNVAGQTRFYPAPPAGTTLSLSYVAWHPRITSGTTEGQILIPLRHHRMIVLGALYKLYMMEDDPDLSAVFKAEYENRGKQMREDLMRWQYQRPDHIYVVDEYDFSTY